MYSRVRVHEKINIFLLCVCLKARIITIIYLLGANALRINPVLWS